MTCKGCGGVIDLKSQENRLLITGTESHCTRIETALNKQSKAHPQRTAPKRTPSRMPMGGKKSTQAAHVQVR
jgi:hypothetical protein